MTVVIYQACRFRWTVCVKLIILSGHMVRCLDVHFSRQCSLLCSQCTKRRNIRCPALFHCPDKNFHVIVGQPQTWQVVQQIKYEHLNDSMPIKRCTTSIKSCSRPRSMSKSSSSSSSSSTSPVASDNGVGRLLHLRSWGLPRLHQRIHHLGSSQPPLRPSHRAR